MQNKTIGVASIVEFFSKPTWLKNILLLTVFLFVISGCEQSNERKIELVNIHIKQAESYIKSGQYRAATIEAKNVIRKAPRSNEGFILLASVLIELGQYKNALVVLDQAPTNTPVDSKYVITKMKALLGRGKFQSALDTLKNQSDVIKQNPAEFSLLEAQALTGLGLYAKAQQLYQQLIDQQQNTIEALAGLADLSIQQTDFEQADKYLDQIDQLAPDNVKAGLFRAQISLASQNLEAAESYLSDTLTKLKDADTLTPQKAGILQVLSEVLVKQGRSAEALIYTQLLADAFPGYNIAQEQYQQAYTNFKTGDLDSAETILEELLDEHPGFENAALMLAIIKYQKGDYEGASSHFNPHVDPELTHPDVTRLAALSNLRTNQPRQVMQLLETHSGTQQSAKLLTIYGSAALAEKNYDKGIQALERAIQLEPATMPAYTSLAAYYASKEPADITTAIKYLQSAYQLDNSNPAVASQLVRLFVDDGQFSNAKRIVEQRLTDTQGDTQSLHLAGNFYSARGDIANAKNYFERVLKREPDNYIAALKLAEISSKSEIDFSKTLAGFKRAINIKPSETIAYQRLLLAAQQANQVPLAEQQIQRFAEQSNTSAGYAVLAIYFAAKQDISKAEQYLDRIDDDAIDKTLADNSRLNVYYMKALALLSNEQLIEAKENIFSALRIQPKSLRLLSLLAEIEIASENYTEAEKLATQITGQNQALASQLRGSIARAQSDFESAVKHFQQAWNTSANDNIGAQLYALLKNNDPAKAELFLNKWLTAVPQSVPALLARSRDLLVVGEFPEAITLMEKVKSLSPDNVTNLNNLAWALQQVNDNRAQAIALQAYNLAPDNASVADTYGWILYQNGQREEALKILSQAAALAPDNTEISNHLNTVKNSM